jgi:hypothetical protein
VQVDRLSTSNREMQGGRGKASRVGDLFQTLGRVMKDIGIESYMKAVALRIT